MEENAAENNEFKNLIRKTLRQGFTKQTKREYFMKKLPTSKKKQCTKNEVESEQAVMEMPITRNKCGNKQKVVKNDKIKMNTNKTSASSMPSKESSPVNLTNWLNSLMVTE